MSSNICKKCGKFAEEESLLNGDGDDKYCGDCAIEVIMEKHNVSYDYAYRVLERYQFGNGKGW